MTAALRLKQNKRIRITPRVTHMPRAASVSNWDLLGAKKWMAYAVSASVVVHAVLAVGAWWTGRGQEQQASPPRKIEIAVVSPPAPAVAVKSPPKPLPKPVVPPPNLPPPPVVEAPKPTPPPVLVTGISLSSTTTVSSMKVNVGNTMAGEVSDKAVAPEKVKLYKAEQYAPFYLVSELPECLNTMTRAQMNAFYPPDARKAGIEAEVRVRLLIDDDGSIVKVTVLKDPGYGFADAAVKVGMRQKCGRPARLNGKAVATELEMPIRFSMSD